MRVFFAGVDFDVARREQYVAALYLNNQSWLGEMIVVYNIRIERQLGDDRQGWAIYPGNLPGPIGDLGWARAHREWDLRATADMVGGLVLSPATLLLYSSGDIVAPPSWGRVTRVGDPVEVVEPIRYRRVVVAPDLHLAELDRMTSALVESAVTRPLTEEVISRAWSQLSGEPPRKKPKDPNWKPNVWEA